MGAAVRTQVAAGDHDGVGGLHNLLDVGHRVVRLHLGNDLDDLPGTQQ